MLLLDTFLRLANPSTVGHRVSVTVIGLAFLAVVATGALAQSVGCTRCADSTIRIGPFTFSNPFASSSPGAAPGDRGRLGSEHRGWERRGSDNSPRRRIASANHASESHTSKGEGPGGSIFVCVRTCDGSFFPMPYAGASGATLQEICGALCPNAPMALYTMPYGGTIDEGVSLAGSRYASEPNALKFQQSYEPSCSCRQTGQSWANALASAEAKYGHRSHELVVTAEVSAQMSRPKADPNAKKAAADAKLDLTPAASDFPDPGLDANGVDTQLKAATEAVSRETSGIREDDIQRSSHFGLKEGRVFEEKDPDGGVRRVRVLSPMF